MTKSNIETKGFTFKQFTIYAGNSGMPVSTDGVLLGAWAQAPEDGNLLDIGTGTGLLALMCAQRYSRLSIDAVEIETAALSIARKNFAASPWSQRLHLQQGDILALTFAQRFDAIICNPPYFNSGQTSEKIPRATARHTLTLDHQSLLWRCHALLKPDGKASFILPLTEGEQFIELAHQCGLHLTRCCRVKPSDKKPCHRLLLELSHSQAACQYEELVIQNSAGYTAQFITLTKNFYLKM